MGKSMNHRVITLSVAILGLTFLFASSTPAQRGGGSGRGGGPGRVGAAHGGGARHHSARFRGSRGFYNGYSPYYFYPDYGFLDYDTDDMVEAPPPPFPMAPPPPQATAAPAPNPPESVMLELQGDRWVRITNYGQSEAGGQPNQDVGSGSSMSAADSRRIREPEPPAPLPSAVLVFRDGRQEEIEKYVIVGKTIHIATDFWTSGSWSKNVQIAELDVPATMKLNQQRGTKFSLPSGPNEVMFRP
jgi:hypothetical protein